jgi:protoporphyrin/coproporphyrin ferrochelatase
LAPPSAGLKAAGCTEENISVSLAILLMAHGTPSSLDEMPEYLTRVRGGRPPSGELLAEMRHNYGAIGGRSPLTEITLRQRNALRERLGPDVKVMVGMRNWHPFIADVLRALAGSGVTRVVGIPLAPQFSTLSVQKYVDAAQSAMPPGIAFECVGSYHDHPLLLEAFAQRIREAGGPGEDELVVFTAHAVPERVIAMGDPYLDQVRATARGVAAAAGIARYEIAFQSAGRTPEPWIGPDLGAFIRERAAAGVRRVMAVPIGFVCDHTEILFDIDLQARGVATECGVALRRPESLNESPSFIAMLADLAARTDAVFCTPSNHA